MGESELNNLIKKYINHCRYEKNLDPKTLKAYNTDLLQFYAFYSSSEKKAYKEVLQSYIASLHNDYASKSVNRKIASLKAFFSYLEYEEIIEPNPFSKIRAKVHSPSILPRTIPLTSLTNLLQCSYRHCSSLQKDTYQYRASLRDIAVLELLFASGMRISELCCLHETDVDLYEGTIRIFGKGAKERLIQIGNRAVLLALQSYHAAFSVKIRETGWFFVNRLGNRLSDQSVRIMINNYCQIAGVEQHITPHMFRHSFATYLLEEDVDIRYIQMLLGHSSIVTTQIYTHVTSKKQRDILVAKHPRNKISIP